MIPNVSGAGYCNVLSRSLFSEIRRALAQFWKKYEKKKSGGYHHSKNKNKTTVAQRNEPTPARMRECSVSMCMCVNIEIGLRRCGPVVLGMKMILSQASVVQVTAMYCRHALSCCLLFLQFIFVSVFVFPFPSFSLKRSPKRDKTAPQDGQFKIHKMDTVILFGASRELDPRTNHVRRSRLTLWWRVFG